MDKYSLPKLPFGYKELEPHISEPQLTIHHQKHHQAYVNAANAIFDKLDKARKEGTDIDMKGTFKDLSFQIGGHILHSMFWDNLSPKGGGKPSGTSLKYIEENFGTFERFKKEFSSLALSVEGSGWAAVAHDTYTNRLHLMQIEKHNTNIYPLMNIILVLDVFEHAYYIDYKNERAKFIEAFWNIVNWETVNKRLG